MRAIKLFLSITLLVAASPSSADTGPLAPAPMLSSPSACEATSTPGPAWTETAATVTCSADCGSSMISCTGFNCTAVERNCAIGEPGYVACNNGEEVVTCPSCPECTEGDLRRELSGCCCWLPQPKGRWAAEVCVNGHWQRDPNWDICYGSCPGPKGVDPCQDDS